MIDDDFGILLSLIQQLLYITFFMPEDFALLGAPKVGTAFFWVEHPY